MSGAGATVPKWITARAALRAGWHDLWRSTPVTLAALAAAVAAALAARLAGAAARALLGLAARPTAPTWGTPEAAAQLLPDGAVRVIPHGARHLLSDAERLIPHGAAHLLPNGAAHLLPDGAAHLLPDGAAHLLPDGAAHLLPNGAAHLLPDGAAHLLRDAAARLVPDVASQLPDGALRLFVDGALARVAGDSAPAFAGDALVTFGRAAITLVVGWALAALLADVARAAALSAYAGALHTGRRPPLAAALRLGLERTPALLAVRLLELALQATLLAGTVPLLMLALHRFDTTPFRLALAGAACLAPALGLGLWIFAAARVAQTLVARGLPASQALAHGLDCALRRFASLARLGGVAALGCAPLLVLAALLPFPLGAPAGSLAALWSYAALIRLVGNDGRLSFG